MNNFIITELARAKLIECLESINNFAGIVRIGIKGGGCSGYSYVIDTKTKHTNDNDIIFSFKNLKICIDKKSMKYLNNATLDYKKSLMYSGFNFKNPNTKIGCGCGQSFSI
tara:strand:- start:1467 stop:1799 length:333 start_codon:yes stop_codon:yes gene_type:complete